MTGMTTESSGIDVKKAARRVGDVQRAEYAETLADAFARGELSRVELDARTELCLAAVTDADLARLVADLPDQTPEVPPLPSPDPSQRVAHLLTRAVAFELVLIVIAYVLGVDLESELRSWYFIAFEIWAVGTAAGVGGALLLRPSISRTVGTTQLTSSARSAMRPPRTTTTPKPAPMKARTSR